MSIKYLYILSQRYSGSTLLSFLLATHPDISTIGERRKFYVKSIRPQGNTGLQCSCGKYFQECDFWNAVREKVLARVDPLALKTNATEFYLFRNKYLNRLAREVLQAAWLQHWPFADRLFVGRRARVDHFNQVLVEAILEQDGNQVFLDSSKSIEQALFLSRIKAFDLHLIWLSRDPRAQVASAVKYHHWSIEEATRRWKTEMDRNERILQRMNVKYTKLTYESLCRDPEQEMKRLLQFAGLEENAFSLDFRDYEQHIMGNYYMRLGMDTRIVERKDWLEKLQPEEIATIEKMTRNYHEYYTTL